MQKRVRLGYPSDVSDEEWAFVAPYLALCREDAAQRDYPLRDVFNALRYIAKTGSQWRFLPNDLPPWTVVYQQMRRWIDAQCFETMVEDLRILLREFAGRKGQPTAMILDSEGAETEVLRGFGSQLKAAGLRVIVFEAPNDFLTTRQPADLYALVHEAGFTLQILNRHENTAHALSNFLATRP